MQRVFLAVITTASLTASAQVPIRTLAVDGDSNGSGDVFARVVEPSAGANGVACVEDAFAVGLACTSATGLLAPVVWTGDQLDDLAITGYGDGLTTTADVVIADNGDVAAIAQVLQLGTQRFVVALRRAGTMSLVSKPGEAAPGGGTFAGDASDLRASSTGTFTFMDGGRLFVIAGGGVALAQAAGDALPGGGAFAAAARGLLDDAGNVYVNGCTSDFNWTGSSTEPTGRCVATRIELDGGRSGMMSTLDEPLGRTGFVVNPTIVAVARDGRTAMFVELYDEAVGRVLDLYRVNATGTAYVDLADDDAPFSSSGQSTGLLLDDGSFLYLAIVAGSPAVVRLDGTTTVLAQNGGAAPDGGTFTLIEFFASSPAGEYAIVARTSVTANASALFMTRNGGVLESVIAEGETLQVRVGDVRTVETLRLLSLDGFGQGAGSAMGGDGSLAFFASFTDGTHGAFLAGVQPLDERPNLRTTVTLIEDEALLHARTTWRVVVENAGTSAAEDVNVYVAFNFDLRVPSAPGFFSECTEVNDGVGSGNVIGAECVIGTLGPGQSQQLEFPTRPGELRTITTTATPSQSTVDADPTDDVGTLDVDVGAASADLAVIAYPGVRVTNNGPSGAEVVRVTGVVDAEIDEITASAGTVCTVSADRGGFACTHTEFLEDTASFRVDFTVLPGDADRNAAVTVVVEGDGADPALANNQATSEIFVPGRVLRDIDEGCDCSSSAGGLGAAAGPCAWLAAAFLCRRRRRA